MAGGGAREVNTHLAKSKREVLAAPNMALAFGAALPSCGINAQ